MFPSNMSHERWPLCLNEFLKTSLSGCCSPVQMVSNSSHLVVEDLETLFPSSFQHLLRYWEGNMPYIKKVFSVFSTFPYPLSNPLVSIGYESIDSDILILQWFKTSFCSFKLSGSAAGCFSRLKRNYIFSWLTYMNMVKCQARRLQEEVSLQAFPKGSKSAL